MDTSIQFFLHDVKALLQLDLLKKEESLQRGERFNMFEILGVAHYELLHSKIIASILDPNGSHGQYDTFLKLFISVIGDAIDLDTKTAVVETEVTTEEGRIDILITDNENKSIIIENKLYASDQPEQLIRYDRYAKKNRRNHSIYYLSLFRAKASENSAKDVEYYTISYAENIISWLKLCIKECAAKPLIRETLIQYLNHLKVLTNQDMDTQNEEHLLKLMADNADAVAVICNNQDKYKQFVYESYVKPAFESFGKDNDLEFVESNLFSNHGERGFYFRKKEWMVSAIWVYTERAGEWDFHWGVSNYCGDQMNVVQSKLDSLNNQPTNGWPYGWEYLPLYRNWDMNTLSAMVKGDYAQTIIKKVSQILEEIVTRKLPMP
ncbi:MAG: PD-(D/E)XK nuclease family protein [Bacteroidales bacterium]|nr:PD-(D/E)XK nuclease family protein [Bacteroidales bacterium]